MVAIEFAIIALPLLLTIVEIFQGALFVYNSSRLDSATQAAARQILTGSVQNGGTTTAAQFTTNLLCPLLPATMPCGNVIVNLQTFSGASYPGGYDNFVNSAQTAIIMPPLNNTQTSFCPGGSGQYVYLQVYYAMPCSARFGRSPPRRPFRETRSPSSRPPPRSRTNLINRPTRRRAGADMGQSGSTMPAHALAAKLHRRAKEFWRARQAIAAVEFALVLPLLIILMLGSVETARAIIAVRKVTLVANTVVEMLSQNQPDNPNETPNEPSSVTYIDLHFAIDSTMVIFPQILQAAAQKGISWKNDISISMASVVFTPKPSSCTSNCSYNANVVWNSGPNKRTCGVLLTPVADTATPSKTTLPTDVFPAAVGAVHRHRSSSSTSSIITRRFLALFLRSCLALPSSARFRLRVLLTLPPGMPSPPPLLMSDMTL